jgi:hypothetical protein
MPEMPEDIFEQLGWESDVREMHRRWQWRS